MEIVKQKILLVDDEHSQRMMMELSLRGPGRIFQHASDGDEALALAVLEIPDIILTDHHMPKVTGVELVERLRKNPFTAHIPIIIVSADSERKQRVAMIRAGSDDVILKPYDPEELAARVDMVIARTLRHLCTDSLTRLPGNVPTREQIARRVAQGKDFAIVYLDIDHFKAFVDRYGYERPSHAIATVARIIERSVRETGGPSDFVGHIGGDDFVILAKPERARAIGERVLELFDERAPSFYDEEDRERGYIVAHDRDGNLRTFPVMTFSAVIISGAHTGDIDVATLADLVARLKAQAKRKQGSTIVEYDGENP
jgi:PleD family two-component response regulator